MESSKIYDLIENSLIYKWVEELEKEENNIFKKDVKKSKQELCCQLNEEQKGLVDKSEGALGWYWEFVYYNVNIRILNLGVKIGMQLQQAFDAQEDR